MRVFVALRAGDLFAFGPGAPPEDPDDPHARLSVEALETSLKGAGGKLRFVARESRHLTIKFLGEVDGGREGELAEGLLASAAKFKPFPVGVRGIGFFPTAQKPRVIWVGVDDPSHQLIPLHRAIQDALSARGFERGPDAFVPHITIARVTQLAPGGALAAAVDPLVNTRFGWTRAAGLDLIESTLTPQGPIHKELSHHLFAGAK